MILRIVRRPIEYQLIFTDLVKACTKAGQEEDRENFDKCLCITSDIASYDNIMIDAGKIENWHFEDDITQQGDLKHSRVTKFIEPLGKTWNGKITTREGDCSIFIFEKCLVVCSRNKPNAPKKFYLLRRYHMAKVQVNISAICVHNIL